MGKFRILKAVNALERFEDGFCSAGFMYGCLRLLQKFSQMKVMGGEVRNSKDGECSGKF